MGNSKEEETSLNELVIRTATPADAPALYALVSSHQAEGHLLPRTIDDIREHAHHFVVCDVGGALKACAELAPLSARLAEVRSLVVAGDYRRVGVAARLVGELRTRATASGFTSLCALTHDARFFVRQNFSIVPHVWLPEKIAKDCHGCALFRQCGQYAMLLPLTDIVRRGVRPAAAPRRVAVA
ncbi:MAG: GNAT family N-acetyltransferase [Acidobacteriota bacterium]